MGSPVTSRIISMPCGVCGADASAGSSARMIARLSLNGYTSISNRRPSIQKRYFVLWTACSAVSASMRYWTYSFCVIDFSVSHAPASV